MLTKTTVYAQLWQAYNQAIAVKQGDWPPRAYWIIPDLRYWSLSQMRSLKRVAVSVVVGWVMGLVPVAFAEVKPTTPPQDLKPAWQWVAAIGIFGACGAILFKNSKRSHQD